MNEVAQVIADLVRAGVDPELIGRVAATIANPRPVESTPTRSAGAERTARWRAKRHGDVTGDACDVTGDGEKESFPHTPFKEKINISTRARPKSGISDDWEPDAKTWNLADELGFTNQEAWDQLARMRDWAKNAGPKGQKSDWNAAFRNWLKRASDDSRSKPKATVQRGSLADSFAILDAVTDEAIRRAGGHGAESSQEAAEFLPGLRKSAA